MAESCLSIQSTPPKCPQGLSTLFQTLHTDTYAATQAMGSVWTRTLWSLLPGSTAPTEAPASLVKELVTPKPCLELTLQLGKRSAECERLWGMNTPSSWRRGLRDPAHVPLPSWVSSKQGGAGRPGAVQGKSSHITTF